MAQTRKKAIVLHTVGVQARLRLDSNPKALRTHILRLRGPKALGR